MTRPPEELTFGATAGGVMLATAMAVALILYAALTFMALVPAPPALDLVRLAY